MAIRDAGLLHGRAGRAVRALLHVPAGSRAALLLLPAGIHGRDAGHVLSGNLIQLVVFWELTSLTSFMLIAYWYHRARCAARRAYGAHRDGGRRLVPAAGRAMLGSIVGSYDLDRVLASGETVRAHQLLPDRADTHRSGRADQERPISVSFLVAARDGGAHAGIGLSAFGDDGEGRRVPARALVAGAWRALTCGSGFSCGAGLCSLLGGPAAALFQRDLKGVLAYSTISHLGLITLLLGMNSQLALVAAVFHMMNHATFKASLFMAAGIVDHETGTRDMRRLSGLSGAMPITATVAMVAAAAMAGVPLLNGFLSKEMFFAETIFAGQGALTRIGLPADRHPCGHVQRGVLGALHSQRVLRTPRRGSAARAARADARHAGAECAAGAGMFAGRRISGADHRTFSGSGGEIHPRSSRRPSSA